MGKSFELNFNWRDYFIVSENFIRQKENSEIEFKESFHSPKAKDKKLHKWIASFANSNGGIILYGVKNNGELIGLKDDKLKNFDNKDLSQELLDYFAPEIKFDLFIKEVESFQLGFLYTHKATDRPVVTIKSANNNIQESDIFYRYPGQSKKISYGDLRNIIEERYQRLNDSWLKLMKNVASIGVENVGILNIENGELIGSTNKLLIPSELLSKVKFINEGKFVEREGAPTLKLIGDVQPIDSNKIIKLVERKYQIITHFELYKSFFEQTIDADTAKEFFRKVLYENTVYYPIYYYLVNSEMTPKDVEKLLENEVKAPKVSSMKERFRKEETNPKRFEIGNLKTKTDAAKGISKAYESLKSKKVFEIEKMDSSQLRYFIQALTHLKKDEFELEYITSLLKEIYDNHFNISGTTKSFIRKVICHIDLVYFGSKYFEKK